MKMRMRLRLVVVEFVVSLLAIPCFGVSTYKGLLPGFSTRNDVEKTLGSPVREISNLVFEYSVLASEGKLLVEYRAPGNIVERIERTFVNPISRAALVRALKLSEEPEDKGVNKEGHLVEYFNDMKTLALTHISDTADSGVISIGYYSLQLFAAGLDRARNPMVQFDPANCQDVYQWAMNERDVAKRSKNVLRHQDILEIQILAQRGECEKARKQAESYKQKFHP